MGQVPPRAVGQVLRAAVGFPRAYDVERVVVQQRDATRTVLPVGAAPCPSCSNALEQAFHPK
ncbi:MAG: hypothetical protein ACRDQA_06195 [Nocardioidaceae bacterium]